MLNMEHPPEGDRVAPSRNPRPLEDGTRHLADTPADREWLTSYLKSVDHLFTTPLSERGVDLGLYARKLLEHGIVAVVPRGAGQIGGVVAFYANDHERRVAYLSLVVVAGDAQGKGVGTQLVTHALAVAAQRGMQRMRLEVLCNDTKAQAFYQRLGFRTLDVRKDGGPGPASLYMERPLG